MSTLVPHLGPEQGQARATVGAPGGPWEMPEGPVA